MIFGDDDDDDDDDDHVDAVDTSCRTLWEIISMKVVMKQPDPETSSTSSNLIAARRLT